MILFLIPLFSLFWAIYNLGQKQEQNIWGVLIIRFVFLFSFFFTSFLCLSSACFLFSFLRIRLLLLTSYLLTYDDDFVLFYTYLALGSIYLIGWLMILIGFAGSLWDFFYSLSSNCFVFEFYLLLICFLAFPIISPLISRPLSPSLSLSLLYIRMANKGTCFFLFFFESWGLARETVYYRSSINWGVCIWDFRFVFFLDLYFSGGVTGNFYFIFHDLFLICFLSFCVIPWR
ncbi:hypothetical protein DFH27DRAFT_213860 [Peziza echinospora]|nr:hypothetical protein DFH27DRAFT_213860 [Peziza echinospora]